MKNFGAKKAWAVFQSTTRSLLLFGFLSFFIVQCSNDRPTLVVARVDGVWDEVQKLSFSGVLNNANSQFPASTGSVSHDVIEAQIILSEDQTHLVSGEPVELLLHVDAKDASGCIVASAEGRVQVVQHELSRITLTLVREAQKLCRITIRKLGAGTGDVRSDATTGSSGIDCGISSTQCSVTVPTGQAIVLRATPGPNSHFGGWGSACKGQSSVCHLPPIQQSIEIDAQFTLGVCTTPFFCWESPLPQGNTLRAISGTAQNSPNPVAWAVGENGTILERKDGGWYGFWAEGGAAPVTQGLFGVNGKSLEEAWAVGENGTILRWDGMTWGKHPQSHVLTTQNLLGTSIISPGQVWIVGDQATILECTVSTCTAIPANDNVQKRGLARILSFGSKDAWAVGTGGVVQRYDNAGVWTPNNYTPMGINNLSGIWSLDSKTLWAVGQNNLILRNDGMGWVKQNQPELGSADLRGIWGADNNRLWAVGNGGLVVHTENGTSWQSIPSPSQNFRTFFDIWGHSAEEVVIVGEDGIVLRSQGQSFTPEAASFVPGSSDKGDIAPREPIFAISGVGGSDIWAVGQSGLILHWDGQRWRRENNPDPEQRDLYAVSAGDHGIWAVGKAGVVLHRQSTGTSGWELDALPQRDTLRAIAQNTTGVVAVGDLGAIWRRPLNTKLWIDLKFRLENFYAVFGRGPQIWVAGEPGGLNMRTIYVSDNDVGMGWTSQSVPANAPIRALWGGSDGGMWAAGDGIILRLEAGVWSTSFSKVGELFLAVTGNQDEVWAAGNSGLLFKRTLNVWNQVNAGTKNSFRGIFSWSPGELLLVGAKGTILRHIAP